MTPEEFVIAWGKAFLSRAPIIIALGIGGIVVIAGLLWAWRNHQRRLETLEENRQRRRQSEPYADAWASAADRLDDDPTTTFLPPPSDLADDDEADDLDDPDDDIPPWER